MKKAVVVTIVVVVVLVAVRVFLGKKKYDSMLAVTSQGLSFGKAYGKMAAQSDCILGLKIVHAHRMRVICERLHRRLHGDRRER